MHSLCLAVKKKYAEEARQYLLKHHFLVKDAKIKRDETYVHFPVTQKVEFKDCYIHNDYFEVVKRVTYENILHDRGIELDSLSLDVVGTIAIIRLKDETIASDVADAILATNPHITTVCLDRGVQDTFRIRALEILAGLSTTETIHVEHGLKMKVDVAKVYFSPRLASERMRVANNVQKDACIIDMFAGVAPFSLIIARFAEPQKIYAIDKNPVATSYAKENIRLNHLDNIIDIHQGDAIEVIETLPHADHIIMNLPHQSYSFLAKAFEKGTRIHYYEILEKNVIQQRIQDVKTLAEKEGYCITLHDVRVVGSYSPMRQRIAIELSVKQR